MSKQKSIGLALVGALALTSLLLTVTGAWARPDERGLAAPLVPDTVVSDTISYQGQLLDSSGDPVDGTQVMTFSLYAGAGYTTPFWSQSGSVAVNDGLFNVDLDVDPLLFDGKALWLGVQVEGDAQEMTPRQPLLPAPYALSLRPGAVVSGTVNRPALSLVNTGSSHALWGGGDSTYAAIYGENSGTGVGVRGDSDTGFGVFGFSDGNHGVHAESIGAAAGFFSSTNGIGVQANTRSTDPNDGAVVAENEGSGHGGVFFSASGYGVYGESTSSINAAGYFTSADSIGVQANTRSADPNDGAVVAANDGSGHGGVFFSANGYGVYGESSSSINAAGYFTSTDSIGVQASTRSADPNDGAVVAANDGSGHGGVFFSANGHGIYVGEAGGDYIRAGSNADPDFRVANDGTVYTDRGYNCGNSLTGSLSGGAISESDLEAGPCLTDDSPADFAEMLVASGDPAPGDVLVINTEGRLVPSTTPYAVNVVGVHSTKPSYLGGGDKFGQEGYVPLAIVGLVPVKASAENGPITPGDLLVSSATPGHAMKAGRNPLVGTVIGKALEGLDTGTGIIMMLVVLQ